MPDSTPPPLMRPIIQDDIPVPFGTTTPEDCHYCAQCRPMGLKGCLGHYPDRNERKETHTP